MRYHGAIKKVNGISLLHSLWHFFPVWREVSELHTASWKGFVWTQTCSSAVLFNKLRKWLQWQVTEII